MSATTVTPDQLEAFFARQRELLALERQAEVDQSSLLISNCSSKLLERRGLALLGLAVVQVRIGLGGKSLIELERPTAHHSSPTFPPHSFRPGDLARIDEGSASGQAPRSTKASKSKASAGKDREGSNGIEGVVYKVSSTRIIIAVDGSNSTTKSDELDIPEHCWVVKLANTVTFDRMDQAVERMSRIMLGSSESTLSTPAPSPLQRVLFGLARPSRPNDIGDIQYFNPSGLNPSQKEAVKLALSAPELALIHGPPGTGKTHTLIEIILQLVSRNKKVLVCGASNLAVDNLLERLVPHKIPLIRLGHPARVMGDLQDTILDAQADRSDEAQLANDVKKEIEALMATMAGGSKGKKIKGAERKKMWEEVKELRKEYRKREGVIVSRVVNEAKIILATCHGSGGRQLFNREFDVVVIDEAAQAVEAVCWIPILKAKKIVIAGDNNQLPPTVISSNDKKKKIKTKVSKGASTATQDAAKIKGKGSVNLTQVASKNPSPPGDSYSDTSSSEQEMGKAGASGRVVARRLGALVPSKSLEVTLFDRMERMWGDNIKQMLNIQYRMNDAICAFPSSTLYSSKLSSDASVARRLLSDDHPDKDTVQDTLGHPVVFFDTSGCEFYERADTISGESKSKVSNDEGSKCNANEVEVVRSWVRELVSCGISPREIAILTPYQAQLSLLSTSLLPTFPELEIGTVDGMQGREKDTVIISMVRSNDKREVGFLKEKRRLNVAMTRARKQLVVVGDGSTVRNGSAYLKKWIEWLEENADVRFGGDV